jgi:threonine dehydratase
MTLPVTLEDVLAAAARIEGAVERTPSARSHTLSAVLGAGIVVKFENLQFTAAFKERGALNKLLTLTDDERRCGVVAMSAGNHAQAVARHATRLGIEATIVMPAHTPFVKVQRTEVLGARVVLHGADLGEATHEAQRLAAEGRTFVHPYDDPAVIAGQGTVALELLADHPELDALVVPTGGGGLLAGMAVVARSQRPSMEIVGVQSDRWPSMIAATTGEVVDERGGATIAEGIAVPVAGTLTSEIIRELVDEIVTVQDTSVEEAMNLLLEIEKVVVEGAGAAGIAALLEHPARLAGREVGVVLSGGNLDPRLLASVIMRGLVRSGRLTRLHVEIPDVPGALGLVTTTIGQAGGNIVEIGHQRMFLDVSARAAELEVVVETLDHDHVERVVVALDAVGLTARVGNVMAGSPLT